MLKNILAVVIFSSFAMISCNNNETKENGNEEINKKGTVVADSIIVKKGKSIAMGTFKILSSKLKSAINAGGPLSGIDVCSSEAMKLTDSISKVYNVDLKRTSLKYRNKKNMPSTFERMVLESWEKDIIEGKSIKPNITKSESGITFIAPIKLKHQCVACHGSDDFVTPEVRLKIKEHYPNDLARNYKEGDLRGAWVISFPKDYFKE